jgi:hypothetical protein
VQGSFSRAFRRAIHLVFVVTLDKANTLYSYDPIQPTKKALREMYIELVRNLYGRMYLSYPLIARKRLPISHL